MYIYIGRRAFCLFYSQYYAKYYTAVVSVTAVLVMTMIYDIIYMYDCCTRINVRTYILHHRLLFMSHFVLFVSLLYTVRSSRPVSPPGASSITGRAFGYVEGYDALC